MENRTETIEIIKPRQNINKIRAYVNDREKIRKQQGEVFYSKAYINAEGELKFTNWLNYNEISWSNDEYLYNMNFNQRTQLYNEIVLELDPHKDIKLIPKKAKKEYDKLISLLDTLNIEYRAYCTEDFRHLRIETFWDKIAQENPTNRAYIREVIINHFGCDSAYNIDKKMLSFGIHYKTGKEIKKYKESENFKENPINSYEKIRGLVDKKAEERLKQEKKQDIGIKEYKKLKYDYSEDNYFNIKYFNNSSLVFINEDSKIYEHLQKTIKNNSFSYGILWKLYAGELGAGNKRIIIKSNDRITKGDNNLYLKELKEEEILKILQFITKEGLCAICKELNVSTTTRKKEYRGREELISEIKHISNAFYKLTLPADKEQIKNIGNVYNTLKLVLNQGINKDDLIDYISIADIPEINPNLINIRDYQHYAPHKILITNEKVGKSFNAYMITSDTPVEDASRAGLIGYSDSKKRHYGILHGRTKATYIEEVQEGKEEEALSRVLSYEELGETQIGRGMTLTCRGASSITYQGNPKITEINKQNLDFLMIGEFNNFITKITKNAKAFSSRKAITIFNKNLKKVEGKGNKESLEKGTKLIRTIAEGFKDEFTLLFKNENILNFLNTPFDKEYLRILKKIADSCTDYLTKQYILGQEGSYRHTKGLCLRVAWLKNGLNDILKKGSYNSEELVKIAEDELKYIQRINIESFQNIVNVFDSETFKEIDKYHLKEIRPEYLKLAVYTAFEWAINNPDKKTSILPLCELKNYYTNVKVRLKLDEKNHYRSFSRIEDYLSKNKDNFSSILNRYFIEYDYKNKCFIILDRVNFQNKAEDYGSIFKVV